MMLTRYIRILKNCATLRAFAHPQGFVGRPRIALIRRKLALRICPELGQLPDAFQLAQQGADPASCKRGKELLELAYAYAVHTGVILSDKTAPKYLGPPVSDGHRGTHPRNVVRYCVLSSLGRLRSGKSSGVRKLTHTQALGYLSAIWPEDLTWPTHIPRPNTKTGEVA